MAPSTKRNEHWGIVAEFATPADLYHACEKVRDAGYRDWDAYTPFPVHGLDKAMGLKPSKLPFIVLAMGLTGAGLAFWMQTWMSAVNYPLVISGKPYWAWQAFIPVTFELGVLFAAIGAVFGMLALNKLPMLFHPLFAVKRFERVTDDRFFIAIEAGDPTYDPETTRIFLEGAGATHVELVE